MKIVTGREKEHPMKIKYHKSEILIFSLMLLSFLYGCKPPCNNSKIKRLYNHAVSDASTVTEDKIAQLIPISKNNNDLVWNKDKTRVLVVTWKSTDSYEKYIKNKRKTSTDESHVIWVSLVPQLKQFCSKFITKSKSRTPEKVNLRLKQYLGLNYQWKYDVFVEMWVSPDNLFRPCVDPEIYDNSCNIDFNRNKMPKVKGITNYENFYKNLYYSSFRKEPGVPWTGLGYTYDWGSKSSNVGVSEFIIVPGGEYTIKAVINTGSYCN